MYLFYNPDIETVNCLSEDESAHCVRVLRLQKGDEIVLTDGRGTTAYARITNPHPRHCEYEIVRTEKQPPSHNFRLHIAFAPTKNIERVEWMAEKCTEIGADAFTPLLCRFSERKQLRTDRLQKIILSAAKQSLTPYLPTLDEMMPYDEFVRNFQASHPDVECFIAHCYDTPKRLLRDALTLGRDTLILLGPEGDFSEEEVRLAESLGFHSVSLGSSRLRTETAAVVACHTAILMNE